MTAPPPARPVGSRAPRSATDGVSRRPEAAGRRPSSSTTASAVPLISGLGAVLLSAALVVLTISLGRPTTLLPNLTLPLIEPVYWLLSLTGYVLTPIVVIIASGLNRSGQKAGLRDRNFTAKPIYGQVLTWLLVVSFVLGLWHILNMAVVLSDLILNQGGL